MSFTKIIDSFHGEYRWLSNFWIHDTENMLSVEHYYQAAKATNAEDYARVLTCKTPGEAKKMGKEIICRADWEDVRLTLMEHFLREKFFWNTALAAKLKTTSDCLLVEGNTWGDKFWGVCDGEGQNHLGKLLMKIRDEFL
jgi:N-glycosidase YbiA